MNLGAPYLARFWRDVGLTNVDLKLFIGCEEFRVETSGNPHLAKNERDMGTHFRSSGEVLDRDRHPMI
jgi:hypothetical protein